MQEKNSKKLLLIFMIIVLSLFLIGCEINENNGKDEYSNSNQNSDKTDEKDEISIGEQLMMDFYNLLRDADSFEVNIDINTEGDPKIDIESKVLVDGSKTHISNEISNFEVGNELIEGLLSELGVFKEQEFFLEKKDDEFYVYSKIEDKWQKIEVDKQEFERKKNALFKDENLLNLFDHLKYDYDEEEKTFVLKTNNNEEFLKLKNIKLKLVQSGVQIEGNIVLNALLISIEIPVKVSVKNINKTTVDLPEIIE